MKKILFIIAVLLAGCYNDRSSERGTRLGELAIEGIGESYHSIRLVDALAIAPTVTSTDPADRPEEFKYLWTYYREGGIKVDTIARAKDIDWPVSLAAGAYVVTLRVENPGNGLVAYQTTRLEVETRFTKGFYFLKETASGDTELDFHSHDAAVQIPDLLTTTDGSPIKGAPTSLGVFGRYSWVDDNGVLTYEKALVPIGGNDLRVLRVADMQLMANYNGIFFSGTAPAERPLRAFDLAIEGFFHNTLFATERGIYISGSSGRVGYAVTPTGGSRFTGGIMAGDGSQLSMDMLFFFDEQNHRLVYYDPNMAVMPLVPNNGLAVTGIEHRLLYMGSGGTVQMPGDTRPMGCAWAIFDDADPLTRHLYRLNTDVGNAPADKPVLEILKVTAPNFCRANLYAASRASSNLIYAAAGNTLWLYNTGDGSERQLTPEGFDGGKITMLTHKPGIPDDTGGYLIVATEGYKVYLYKLVAGMPEGAPIVLTGTGRVVDMQYVGGGTQYDENL